MKEKLIDIVAAIDSCAKARKGTGVSPIARVHCLIDGGEDTMWFVNSYYSRSDSEKVQGFGRFVPKNSDVAIKMQTYEVGTSFEYDHRDNTKRMQRHRVELENRTNLQNQTIAIAGDTILYQYRNIGEFLDALKQNKDDIDDIEAKISELKQNIEELKKRKGTANQRGQITKSINELQKEYRILTQQQEDLKNITVYIRKQGEMRYSLIVDTVQTRIKSQNLYDGKTVIINGGPGTGKSTTMIHRLAYLTDIYAINEDEKYQLSKYKLNTSQRRLLREAIKLHRDWMFFSPSQMLKEYLAGAMEKEGLTNTFQKVWNWKDYCRHILQVNYALLGEPESKAPFKVCNLSGTLFFQDSNIIEEFTNFYLAQFRKIKSSLPQIDFGGTVYAWTSIAKNIEKRFEDSETFDIYRFILLFNSLESIYSNDCKKLLRDKNIAINDLANEICGLINQDERIKSDIEDYFDLTVDIDDAEIEYVENEELTEKPSMPTFVGNNDKLFKEIQKWLKDYCHCKACENSRMYEVNQLVCEVLLPVLGSKFDTQIQRIGELMIFEQFAQYTRGVKTIMLNGIPVLYKKFRNYLNKSKYEGCDLKLLRDIMLRKQGKELHHQEQSLLLGFINNLVKQIKKSTSANIKHVFFEAYDEVARPIIGIDEATDFSACDIYAIESLLTIELNSLTLCGDMMQRMTVYGIKSWSELNDIVRDPVVVEMKTSYRQSQKLLEVARQIYMDALGETPSYKAFMKSNRVPYPLVYIDENETYKIQWISKRISEVFRAYGEQLPSIAIFVNDKGYISRFIEILQTTEFFLKNGVSVLDGSKGRVGVPEKYISVYPIDVVKGMEFDVVFFHNIDNSSEDMEVLKRYIYVGVSRAAFFLGITMSEQNKEVSKYFDEHKDWFKI